MKTRRTMDDAGAADVIDTVMSAKAKQVMDLYDAGHGLRAISAVLHVPLGTVQRYVRTYDASMAEDLAQMRRVRVSDLRYQDALVASGGMYR